MSAVDRRPAGAFTGLVAAGVVAGLVQLVADSDTTSTGASVATANALHVALALVSGAALVAAYRRDRCRLQAFLMRPFTGAGWSALGAALVAGPLVVAELVLLITGRAAAIGRVERRIAGRLPASPGGEADQWSMVTAAARVLRKAPLRLLRLLAAVVAIYVPFRSGQQVFAALDPDFTRDAWGGPSYVGASLAHWLDGILLFYGCTVLIAWDRKISTDERCDDQVVPQPPRHHVAR